MNEKSTQKGAFLVRCFLPWLSAVEEIGDQCGQCPADGPCHPDACGPEAQNFCEKEGKGDTEEQIGEGACQELQHGGTAAQYPITHDLENNDEIEWCNDFQEICPCLNGICAVSFQKQPHGRFAAEEVEQEERYTDQNPQ